MASVRGVAVGAALALTSVLVVAAAPPAAAAVTVTVDPSSGLADGQPVTVTATGFAPNTFVGTAECTAAVAASRSTDDCDLSNSRTMSADSSGTAVFQLRVKRVIATVNGTVDCATAAEPCVIGAGDISNLSNSGGMQIAFDPNAPPPPPPDVTVMPSDDLLDRQQVAVYATGFVPGEQVIIGECTSEAVADSMCDPILQGVAFATADPVGAVAAGITVRRALRTSGGRVDCASAIGVCVVVARAMGGPDGTAPLGFDASVPLPPPPVITATPSAGLGDRYLVTVTGAGFVPGFPIAVVECPADAASPYTCGFSNSRNPMIDADGTFTTTFQVRSTLQEYSPTKPTPTEVNCAESPGRCVILAFDFNDQSNADDTPLTFDPNAAPAPPIAATVSPSTGLSDGQTVHVTADRFPPGSPLYVIQCMTGSTDASGCDVSQLANPLTDDNGHAETDYVVHRILTLGYGPPTPAPPPTPTTVPSSPAASQERTPAAAVFFNAQAPDASTFDCGSAPGACTLSVAWLGDTIQAVGTPLTFDTTAAPDASTTTTVQQALPVDAGNTSTTEATTAPAQVEARVVTRGPLARTGTDLRTGLRLDLVLLVAGAVALAMAAAFRARGHRRV